ncbi:hypothetical protein FKR81_34285 [Lentzea tibetensis]|uniref:Uncharacterized protein n=1 Tax=Lentzea tibetensis TaxID=2591470 RepID=A0A563EJ72_9PSEU|nr:hypothetical protein [Lentzea tibetensis]TWP46878.1 hypothetical protein FKR81_34285 [Lentzea tibetensis]
MKVAIAVVCVLLALGLGGWVWYLSGLSLQDKDSASSVLAGVAAVIFGVTGVVLGVAALRQRSEQAAGMVGERGVQGTINAPVITGDHNTITGWSPRAMWVIGVIVALAASASIASVVIALRGDPPVRLGAYTVTVRGSAIGGDPFELQGELRIRKATDGQPYEWCMKVGFPMGTPKPGAIWFGTNGTCFGKGADKPVATVRESGGEHTLTPLSPPPPLDQSANTFTATSGLLAVAYQPNAGDVRFRATEQRQEGTLSLQGLALSGLSTPGTFTATFTAVLVSDDPEAQVSSPIDPAFGESEQPAPPPDVKGTRYTIRTITSFKAKAGSEQFEASARSRFAAAVFVIDAREDGAFVYDPPDARDDVFPITGKVLNTGPVHVLAGSRDAGSGLTAAHAEVGGTLDLTGQAPVVRLTLKTTTGMGTESTYEVEAVLQS